MKTSVLSRCDLYNKVYVEKERQIWMINCKHLYKDIKITEKKNDVTTVNHHENGNKSPSETEFLKLMEDIKVFCDVCKLSLNKRSHKNTSEIN